MKPLQMTKTPFLKKNKTTLIEKKVLKDVSMKPSKFMKGNKAESLKDLNKLSYKGK